MSRDCTAVALPIRDSTDWAVWCLEHGGHQSRWRDKALAVSARERHVRLHRP